MHRQAPVSLPHMLELPSARFSEQSFQLPSFERGFNIKAEVFVCSTDSVCLHLSALPHSKPRSWDQLLVCKTVLSVHTSQLVDTSFSFPSPCSSPTSLCSRWPVTLWLRLSGSSSAPFGWCYWWFFKPYQAECSSMHMVSGYSLCRVFSRADNLSFHSCFPCQFNFFSPRDTSPLLSPKFVPLGSATKEGENNGTVSFAALLLAGGFRI